MAVHGPCAYQQHRIMEFKPILMWAGTAASTWLEQHMTSCRLLHCLAYTLRVMWIDGGGGGNGVLAPAIPKLLPMTLMLPLPPWTLSSLLFLLKAATALMKQELAAVVAIAHLTLLSQQ
jgi:hypothetical protein